MHLNAIRDLLHARSFALGLAYGGVAFLASALVALAGRKRVPDVAGLAFVAAAWLGVRGAWGRALGSRNVAVALLVLAAGGALATLVVSRLRQDPHYLSYLLAATAVAITPGAVLLAHSTTLVSSSAARGVLSASTIAVGVAFRDFDATRGPRGAPWLLLAVTAVGIYLAVPDTELARVLLGVSIPFVLLSVPRPLCPLGPAGSTALAGVVCWVVVVGGRGRSGSVVGGLATIGVLFAEPVGRHLFRRVSARARQLTRRTESPIEFDRNQDSWLSATGVAAIVQFLGALYASRVVGRDDDALSAFFILVPMILLFLVVAPELFPPLGDRREDRSDQQLHRHHHGAHHHGGHEHLHL